MTTRPRILASGAYERDNLGDLLFLVVSEYYAQEQVHVDFGAPIARDMTGLLNRYVPSTGDLLRSGEYQGIWSVGGEVGATPREYVYRTAVTTAEWEHYLDCTPAEQEKLLSKAMGGVHLDSPYVPRPSVAPEPGIRLALNSVGVAGIRNLTPWRAAIATTTLREAGFISVRDRASAEFLTRAGIEHRVAPDLVHTLARVMPVVAPRGATALVQLSEAHIEKFGVTAWAEALSCCEALGDGPIRFFIAGTAPAHDSIVHYQALREALLALCPDWDVELSGARSIEARVTEIATARLWIGSSLHGRIISCAYGTRRVSIEKPKVDAYAATWDPLMPAAVEPPDLPDAVHTALKLSEDVGLRERLADSAERSILEALDYLVNGASTIPDTLLHLRTAESAELQTAARALDATVRIGKEAQQELRQVKKQLSRANTQLQRERERRLALENSTSWRLGRRLVGMATRIRIPRSLRRFMRGRSSAEWEPTP